MYDLNEYLRGDIDLYGREKNCNRIMKEWCIQLL